jgi:mycofactocin system glycosyltransferase
VTDVPVVLDAAVRRLAGGQVLLGGEPARLLRLRAGTAKVLDRLAAGGPVEGAARVLARTLVDGGFAHPRPPSAPVVDLQVVVPVRDRTTELARCLAALGGAAPVLVVDDGSREPAAVADVCRRFGARVLRLPLNGGPAAARNAGLAATSSPLIAFVDSDCVPPPGWLAALAGHFADPRVGAVAPRVRGGGADGELLRRYAHARGPLDLGRREAPVRPGSRVPYVPTAALVVRRAALDGAAQFDPWLRYGEDVDLVWRLHDAGWTVRYDPRTVVGHEEPRGWSAWLRRRHRYGTSAAPLAQRHGDRLTPLVLPPWPTAAWLLLALGRPLPGVTAAAVPATKVFRQLRRAGLPAGECARVAVRVASQGVLSTASGLGGAGTVVTAPALLPLLALRATRRPAAVVLLAPALLEWWSRRPAIDPLRWCAVRLVDDLAYASGVWRGCWAARSAAPLRPRRARPR